MKAFERRWLGKWGLLLVLVWGMLAIGVPLKSWAVEEHGAAVHGEMAGHAEAVHGEAAHGAAGHEGGISQKQLKNLLWWAVNFLILVVGLYKFGKEPIANLFRSRREAILNEYEDLMAKKREAEKRYAELQEKLKGLEEEAQRLLEAFREQGEREAERIIAEAKENAERIKKQAELYIQQEMARAKAELQKEVAEMAVRMAEELIRKNITPEDHKRLFNEFIERVERVH